MDDLIYGEPYKDRLTRLARERKYAKARETCNAPRGWEPWSKWEDKMVENLVERGWYHVAGLAKRLQRTENAILCRIEKRYGEQMRAHFTTWQKQYANGGPKPEPVPCWGGVKGWYFPQPDAILSNGTIMDMKMNDDQSKDSEILDNAMIDIQCAKNGPFFDPERFAYRVTPAEYRAIGREIERRQFLFGELHNYKAPRDRSGVWFANITVCGVRLTRSATPPPVLKDYGSSG